MRKILIIEDNEINREILNDILEERYEVLEAENGQQGLALLEQYHQELSVILLDLQMPVMDGFEFLRRVQGDALLSAVPVIVMTADENADTEARCMELGAVEFLEKPYNPVVMFGRIRNIIRMREAAADIQSIEYDDLTGLYTRQAFYHYAGRRLREHSDQAYSLFVVDIRDFKMINSVYGEAVGDQVLTAIADNLRQQSQAEDGLAGHYGADRFLGLFTSDRIPAAEIMEKIMAGHRKIGAVENIRIRMGIYEDVDHSLEVSRICDRAISALDAIKNSYDRQVGTYNGPLAQKHRQEQMIEADFSRALAAGEFEPWFQPKVDPVRGKIVGAEALVRWKMADGTYRAPYLFIPLFERDGLVAQVDACMFRQVCRLQKEWQEQGLPCVPISVNMSRTTLLGSGTAAAYEQMVREAGITCDMVPIEITESAAFLNEQIGHLMERLKEAGFPLHMDDFGSGYSSLTSLGILPFDVTKLDKSLTDNVGTVRGEMIMRHMLQVIHELGMKAVVEGVETEEQVELLKKLGCDAIQGYYYSKPVPKDEFEKMLGGSWPLKQ